MSGVFVPIDRDVDGVLSGDCCPLVGGVVGGSVRNSKTVPQYQFVVQNWETGLWTDEDGTLIMEDGEHLYLI